MLTHYSVTSSSLNASYRAKTVAVRACTRQNRKEIQTAGIWRLPQTQQFISEELWGQEGADDSHSVREATHGQIENTTSCTVLLWAGGGGGKEGGSSLWQNEKWHGWIGIYSQWELKVGDVLQLESRRASQLHAELNWTGNSARVSVKLIFWNFFFFFIYYYFTFRRVQEKMK